MISLLNKALKNLLINTNQWESNKIFFKSTPKNKDGIAVIDITGGRGADVLKTFSPLNYYERLFQIRLYNTDIEKQDQALDILEYYLQNFKGVSLDIKVHKIELISGPLNLGQDLDGLQIQSQNYKIYYSLKEEV